MSERDITCSGCSKEISSGNIISFENDYWHPDCFRCMKCNKLIDISDQNILLCEDKPICSDCGYKCHVCGKAITGEAITADDMILHFSCFKCQRCGKYIDNLTYILVNNEIRCINCTYNIDEDVQNDFGISSPVKNNLNDFLESNNESENEFIVIQDQNNENDFLQLNEPTNNLDIDDPEKLNKNDLSKDKGKKCTAKHCSVLQDKNALHRFSLGDKETDSKLNSLEVPSFEEKNGTLLEEVEEEEDMVQKPNQHNYSADNKKFSDEEYYILKVKNEQLISENDLLRDEQSSMMAKYEEKIEEEIKKNESYEKTINNLLEEKKALKENLSRANETIKKYEEDYKLDALKYENENNLFQIKYEDLKADYEKEKEERIIAESTIVRLQEEIHIRYLDELKYTYIYDIEAKYQNEFELLENQKQCSLSTFEYLNNEINKLNKELNSNKSESENSRSVYDSQSKCNEIINKFKNELSNIQNQKKLLQNEVNLLRNLRKGLINDNLIYMERFRKLKSEEASLQKKSQQNTKKNSLYKSTNESLYFKYDLKKDDSNLDTASIYSTNNDLKMNDYNINNITLQKLESSVNNSFAVYESINKMINDSFQPPKQEKNLAYSSNSDDSKESITIENLNTNENKTNLDEERSVCIIPLNDSPSVSQSKSSTIRKIMKNKKYYGSESVLFNEKKLLVKDDNAMASSDDLQKGESNSPIKLKIPGNSHDFQYHKYLTPNRCEICNNNMWGREAKCKCCNMKCHVKCITEKIPECTKKAVDPEVSALYAFGTDLSKQAAIEPDNVPFIVKKCTEEVEKRGMDFEGIYRKSGRTLLMKTLISIFSRGDDPDLSEDGEFSEITIITSVLKQYFRELPEAVIPPDAYTKLTELISNDEKDTNIQEIKKCIDSLEISHYSTLKYLVKHLIKVSQYSNVNLMSLKNLAVVFGPTLIGSNEICPEVDFSSTGIKVKIINIILENADTIFFAGNDD
ncbi:RhoGAP-domain-containing protein [Anaeromyces robustus]|uniref:RhoGAP-domain-containing protein n=1 Tax=Anaeromyces robustus TaxID=1754192 RepID=A0A1Y1XPX6_9FUNG|nr:RhoGAP-domain-containing protein [Anaeromyces robustus]|eukprot:ORX87792.1 RhoGAP-domain-containing protein [Anaeromyces robustus]